MIAWANRVTAGDGCASRASRARALEKHMGDPSPPVTQGDVAEFSEYYEREPRGALSAARRSFSRAHARTRATTTLARAPSSAASEGRSAIGTLGRLAFPGRGNVC